MKGSKGGIAHLKWCYEDKAVHADSGALICPATTVTYNAFRNPDSNSPIAAVLFSHHARGENLQPVLKMTLVRNRSHKHSAQALESAGLVTALKYSDRNISKKLEEIDIKTPSYLDAIFNPTLKDSNDVSVAAEDDAAQMKHIFKVFQEQPILSEDPAIRRNFINEMGKEYNLVNAVSQYNTSPKKGL